MRILGVTVDEDSIRIFAGAHDYNVLIPDSWTTLNKPGISATLTRYSVCNEILK
jgi:hypothetical protein